MSEEYNRSYLYTRAMNNCALYLQTLSDVAADTAYKGFLKTVSEIILQYVYETMGKALFTQKKEKAAVVAGIRRTAEHRKEETK